MNERMPIHFAILLFLITHAGMIGAPAIENAPNQVLTLDGKTGCMEVSDAPPLHSLSNAMTLELWFKAGSFSHQNGAVNSLLRKNPQAGAENFLLRFRMLSGEPNLEMLPGKNIGLLRVPCPVETNKWYHLAATYNGAVIKAFLNGAELETVPAAGVIEIDASSLLIGRGDPKWSSGEFFNGMLDEIRIWNIARSEGEIAATMNSRLAGNEPGLIAYWNFDDGTPQDSSGHGNRGTLNGGAAIEPASRGSVAVGTEKPARPREEMKADRRLGVLQDLWTNLSNIYPALEYKGISGPQWIEPAAQRVGEAKSDEEFYEILLELMARLNDTHTRIVSYPGKPVLQSPPVFLNRIDDCVAVVRADPATGLAPGDVVVRVDDKPIEECLQKQLKTVCNSTERGRFREACGRLLSGRPGSMVTVTVQNADKHLREVKLLRDAKSAFWSESAISSKKLGESVGYIRISRWGGNDLVAEFESALEQFKNCAGLIIDVRGNGGGDDRLADEVNGRLTARPVVSSIDFWRQQGTDQYRRTIGWVQPRGPWTYAGRVAVLIDEGCASACEHFVSGIEAMGNILLVGRPTNGAGGGPTGVTLRDGTEVRISRALGLRANGVVFEGHGIPPHLTSSPTLADLRQGRDSALELAKEWVLSDKPLPARPDAPSD